MALEIVTRAEWQANPLNTPAGTIATPTPELWLHHTASSGLHGASGMRSLQANALSGGYVDLEYTYVVDTDGTAYMSRGPGHNTAATAGGHNEISHAVCAMGNYEHEQPSDAMLNTIAALVSYMAANRWVSAPRITGPHRDASGNATACCGINLINRIPDLNRMAAQGGGSTPTPQGGGAMELAPTPSGKGYVIVDSSGAVFAYGDARYYGGPNTLGKLAAPCVGIAYRPQGDGYWVCGADGGVFAYGKAPYKGSMAGKKLAAPIVAVAAADDGAGYWLLGADGGVFAYGSAPFAGAPTGLVH